MTITLNRLYTGAHQYNAGTVQINVPFVGNTLAVELTTKPEYADTNQRIGTLFQFYGNAQKAYDLYSGRDVVRLELPETDRLWFSPTSYLSDNYTLTIDYTNVGTVINGSNSASIPEQLLTLPARVLALEASPSISNWIDITNKPLVFPPAIHSHEISDVLGLTTALNGKANTVHTHLMDDVLGLITEFTLVNTSIGNVGNRVTALESSPASSSASQNYTSIFTNITLESNKNYLATVAGLICSLPANPAIGDVINVSTGNFDTKVYQNNGQTILNLSTETPIGSDTGIILKPYGTIQLIYSESGLWVSSYRNRIANNWLAPTATPNHAIAYTPSIPTQDGASVARGSASSLVNGITAPNGNLDSGLIVNLSSTSTYFNILCTFSYPQELDKILYYAGTGYDTFGNISNGSPDTLKVYSGADTTNLLATFTLSQAAGVEQILAIPSGSAYSNYLLSFNNSAIPQFKAMEIDLLVYTITGGEVIVQP